MGKNQIESDMKGLEEIKIENQDENEKKMHNKNLGMRGEDAATKYLENKGYVILDRNWKCKLGEIDIVAKFEDVLIFVEVKTRTNIELGLPEDAVGPKKRRKYESLAAMYLQEHEYVDMAVRFDVVGLLVLKQDRAFIRHHVNAFGIG